MRGVCKIINVRQKRKAFIAVRELSYDDQCEEWLKIPFDKLKYYFVYIPVTDCGALKSRGLLLLSKQASTTCLPRVNFRLITAERVRTFLLSQWLIYIRLVFPMRSNGKR